MSRDIGQVNLVVGDLERSRAFYEAMGFALRPVNQPGSGVVAWVSTTGPVLLGLHEAGFAGWWDPGSPGVAPGSTVIDLDMQTTESLDELVATMRDAGAVVVREPEQMPWGQRYAVLSDPDGHRWGLRA